MTYRVTAQAKRDLAEIWVYIAGDSEDAADGVIGRLTACFRLLREHPGAGRSRDDLRKGYRSFPVGQYLVFYRVRGTEVQILRILHGRRDIQTLLGR